MKILLTGVTGYIGKRLLPVLLDQGHEVICGVREKSRFPFSDYPERVTVVEADFLQPESLEKLPKDIDAAYYLIHSMAASTTDFQKLETATAENFVKYINQTQARQIIYLSGIVNEEHLSKHLDSRKNVEEILKQGYCPVTILRAGIVVGSGSASFEIIRDLAEKLPLMITPKWVKTKCQPIAIYDVIQFLTGVILHEATLNKTFDIAGPEVLTYKEMLLRYAQVRKLKRWIFSVPVMTPRLSSYWLYFVTATSYKLAINLVDSMKINVIARDNKLANILNIHPLSYKEAVVRAFRRIDQNMVVSSWKDALSSSNFDVEHLEYINPPTNGCFIDQKSLLITGKVEKVIENVWAIGGERGWYYATWLWKIRGFIDKLFGGVGLRRGRTSPTDISNGDVVDFWRVLLADKQKGKLLLYAEMKLPGEAWLEFSISKKDGTNYLHQRAIFRPLGIWGRLYWYLTMPFHFFIFDKMIYNIVNFNLEDKILLKT
ncbi:SDR family oxidoreductase [Flexithrix dorotheae]|uniref:SDR family oxidoreductase n=1 Tax=Flexithrix dorotheae TaxID=70993 RepID=UPI00036D9F99|nr:SDR family oxidoreductase [Flexithrix dorotheae]